MARWFILFLIALLPLRGWSVERMALDMQGMPVAAQSQDLELGMSAECALHMQAGMQMDASADAAQAAVHGTDHKSSHKSEHKGCQSCQLCMPLLALDGAVPLHLASPPQQLPRAHSSRFVSADSARNAKPPIS
ncbi:hypothetical protein DIC66_11960 [Rhodoferax lacus]|uniref:DUF2946 domain-containing protein n=2 Tax=Rhodoferax lacus TaxID=2184758 RepID=A0A3E1RBT3_9BURK|nr:hypothetical protein DIC66_11960 [Rhodoferax lacus]